MSTSLPYFPERDMPPTFLSHQHTSPHVHHAETASSSNFRIHTASKMAALQQFNIATPSQSNSKKYVLQVYDIDLHHLPNIGWLHVDHRFYVRISIDDSTTTSSTTPEKPSSMPWKSKHEFDVCDSTTLTFKVFAHRQLHDDQYIGIVQGRVEQFWGYPGIILEQLTCTNPQGNKELLRASLEFKVSSTVDHEKISGNLRSSHDRLDAVGTPFPQTVQIFGIHLHHLPRIGLVSTKDREFYVHASVDEHHLMSTPPVKLHSLWATKLELNVWALSTISLKVFAKRQIHEDQYVGMVQERVEALLANHRTKIYRLIPSDAHGDQLPPCASMEFKIMPVYGTIEPSMTRHVERQSAWTAGAPGGVPYSPNDAWNCIEPAVAAVVPVLPPLLEKFDIFVRLAGMFAEAHPYTKMAFMVLTAAYQVVHAQFERDGRVDRLITVMHDTYSLICDPKELKRMESQEETINFLARQTVECSYFISYYKQYRSGWKESLTNVFSIIDVKIQEYEATFKKLQNAIQAQAVIHTELCVARIHDLSLDHAAKLNLLLVKADFKEMHYAENVSYKSHKVRSAPSGTDIMGVIASWVNQDTGPQIYLLLGHNESEKSSIAYAIAHQFDAIMRLGSSYFFSCAAQDKRNATNLFSTIARHLADHDPQYMKTLWDAVKEKLTLRETNDPLTQFTSFILAPAKKTTCIGPVLVVIDGLEYSGNKTAHEDILTVLAEKGAELPPGFKFLITCRPDEGVCAAFGGKPHVLQKYLPDRISLHNSTPSLDSSNSGSAVSTLFESFFEC